MDKKQKGRQRKGPRDDRLRYAFDVSRLILLKGTHKTVLKGYELSTCCRAFLSPRAKIDSQVQNLSRKPNQNSARERGCTIRRQVMKWFLGCDFALHL
jgi:hypothetical protein